MLIPNLLAAPNGVQHREDDVRNADKPEDVVGIAALLGEGGVVETANAGGDAEADHDDEEQDFQPPLHSFFVLVVHDIEN